MTTNDPERARCGWTISQLASPLAGGLAPLIATALLQWSGGSSWPISLYMLFMVTVTFCSVYVAAETSRTDMSQN